MIIDTGIIKKRYRRGRKRGDILETFINLKDDESFVTDFKGRQSIYQFCKRNSLKAYVENIEKNSYRVWNSTHIKSRKFNKPDRHILRKKEETKTEQTAIDPASFLKSIFNNN
jgi:hypothetical protein